MHTMTKEKFKKALARIFESDVEKIMDPDLKVKKSGY